MAQLEPVPAKTRLAQDGGMVTPPWERWLRLLRRRIRELGTLSTQNANDVTVGDLSVTGSFDVAGVSTLSNNLVIERVGDATWAQIILNADSANQQRIVVTDSGDTNLTAFTYKKSTDVMTFGDGGFTSMEFGVSPVTFKHTVTVDRTSAAAGASFRLNADSAQMQSLLVTDGAAATLPMLEYDKSSDAMRIGSTSMASITFADIPVNYAGKIQWDSGDTSLEHDGTSFLFATTDQYKWITDAGTEVYIYNGGLIDTYAPNASTTGNLLNMRSDVGGTGTIVFRVKANGDVQSATNSYGAISDARLKENITDAPSQWDDVMRVRFRHYNMIGSDLRQLGVVAQELQAANMGGLVVEDEDGTLSVKTSVLTMKALVALQEAMRRIEALETQLKGAA